MAEALLITRNDVVKFTALNGNVDTDNFIQWVKIAQDIDIQRVLGTQLLQKLQSEIILAKSGIPATISIVGGGTDYFDEDNVPTIDGTGTGLTVDITQSGGIITDVTINEVGSGYLVGDILRIDQNGNGDAEITIDSVYTIPTDYNNLLVTYVKPMLIHFAMSQFLPFAAYTIANKGVYKHNSENSTNVEKNEIDYLVQKELMIAQNYTERFIDYISFNNDLFPEYNTNSNGDMFPSTQNNYTGWFI